MNYFIAAMRKYAVFQGRSSRSEFWYFILFSTLITMIAVVIDDRMSGGPGYLYAMSVLIFLLPNLAVAVRRLHDTDRSGWWYLISLTGVGIIVLIVFWCQPGSPGNNQFGFKSTEVSPSIPQTVSQTFTPLRGAPIADLERLTELRAKGELSETEFDKLTSPLAGIEANGPPKGKKKLGFFGFIGIAFFVLVIGIAVFAPPSTTPETKNSEPVIQKHGFKEGDTVNVGYTSYIIWRSWWSSRLSNNRYIDKGPNAMYLFVDLTVRNNDKQARTIPPFKLVDENGSEYESSGIGWAADGAIGLIEDLNPSGSKRGLVVFDVPQERKYQIKLSGGYWSGKYANVELQPAPSR